MPHDGPDQNPYPIAGPLPCQNFHASHMFFSVVLLARPILTPVLSPEDQCFGRQKPALTGRPRPSVANSFIESTVMNDQTRLILVGIVTAAICGVLVYAAFSHLTI